MKKNYLANKIVRHNSYNLSAGAGKTAFFYEGQGEFDILHFTVPYGSSMAILDVDGTITAFTNTAGTSGSTVASLDVIFTNDRVFPSGTTTGELSTIKLTTMTKYTGVIVSGTKPTIKGLSYGTEYSQNALNNSMLVIDGKIYFKKYIKLVIFNNHTSTVNNLEFGFVVKLYNPNS